MTDFARHPPAVTIRPATRDDFPAIAWLLMQLYTAELPHGQNAFGFQISDYRHVDWLNGHPLPSAPDTTDVNIMAQGLCQ